MLGIFMLGIFMGTLCKPSTSSIFFLEESWNNHKNTLINPYGSPYSDEEFNKAIKIVYEAIITKRFEEQVKRS